MAIRYGAESGGGNCYYKIIPGYKASDFRRIVPSLAGNYVVEIEKEHFIYGNTIPPSQITDLGFYQKTKFLDSIHMPAPFKTSNLFITSPSPGTYYALSNGVLYRITGNKSLETLLKIPGLGSTSITNLTVNDTDVFLSVKSKGVMSVRQNQTGKLNWNNISILNNYSVTHFMADNEGGRWFTTLENGIYYLSPNHFIKEYALPDSMALSHFMISRLDNNHIAISKSIDSFDFVSPDTIIHNLNVHSASLPNYVYVHCHLTQPLIINTGNSSELGHFISYRFYEKEKKAKPLASKGNFPAANLLDAIDTANNTIYSLDRDYLNGVYTDSDYIIRLEALPSRTYTCYLDNSTLWLGCYNGLWAYRNNKLEYHGNDNPLLSNRIQGICKGEDGAFYYALYSNGIVIKRNGKFIHITKENGLISNNCLSLCLDSYGVLWIGSQGTISAIIEKTPGDFQITNYVLTDAFPSQKIIDIKQTGNKLWISSGTEIISHSLPFNKPETAPPVSITGFWVNDTKKPYTDGAIMPYNMNRIRISFIGLFYNNYGKLQYEYRLKGLDTNWQTTDVPYVQYQFLPSGKYRFEVKAITVNGTASIKEAHFSFIINKPFWQAFWFIALVAIVCMASVAGFIQYRLKIIRKKEEEKTIMNKRIAEIEMKALRAQMNPHFIFNAINSIQSYILKDDRRQAQDYLARFARLIRNVLENSKLEFISLQKEIETLTLYVTLEQLRSGNKFQFNISIAPDISVYSTLIPPLLLQPFVENSILHGLMPVQNNTGILKIDIKKNYSSLICLIEDNGIGRKKAREIKKHKEPMHQSMGISATEDRINILNSFNHGTASIVIEDIDGESSGTRAIVTIPLKEQNAGI